MNHSILTNACLRTLGVVLVGIACIGWCIAIAVLALLIMLYFGVL